MYAELEELTEAPGLGVTEENLAMLHTRYAWASEQIQGGHVLELAAGPGLGLTYLQKAGGRVTATDLHPALVREARVTHGSAHGLAVADAQQLPFDDASVDALLLFEALYYLPEPERFFAEGHRVLSPGGQLLLCTANKRRPGFVRSPHSHRYHDAGEIAELYTSAGFGEPWLGGAFPCGELGLKDRALLWGFGIADQLRIIPRSLEGRARFKRFLYGDLERLPRVLDPGVGASRPVTALSEAPQERFKVLYAKGERP